MATDKLIMMPKCILAGTLMLSLVAMAAADESMDWGKFEVKLGTTMSATSNLDKLTSDPFVMALRSKNEITKLTEMCAQVKYPLVQLAGFLALKQDHPKEAFSAALTIVWNSPKDDLNLLVPIACHQLASEFDDQPLYDKFSEILKVKPACEECASLAILNINDTFLTRWFDEVGCPNAPKSNVALVLERLCSDSIQRNKKISKKLGECLLTLKNETGHPYEIYLLYYPSVDPDLKFRIGEELKNRDIGSDFIFSLATTRSNVVLELLEQLNISESRKTKIRQMAASVLSRK